MQQQCVQFAPVIVGHHQVQASNDGPGHQLLDTLLDTLLVEGEQLVGAAGGTMCQFVVGRQRGLDVKIKQQHAQARIGDEPAQVRSEEHTSELQSLMRISYAVFCLKKKKHHTKKLTCKAQ